MELILILDSLIATVLGIIGGVWRAEARFEKTRQRP